VFFEVERFEVVFGVVGLVDVVEAGVAQGVGAVFPFEAVGPLPVLSDFDRMAFGFLVGFDPLHGLVVDEELPAVIAGQGDVVVVGAEDDVDDHARAERGERFPARAR